jgi:O-antigen/teichoic acid export membrane protein
MAFEMLKMNTRAERIRVGSLSLLGSTGVTLLVGVLMAGILARYFSPEEFGLWAILMSLNGILINGFDFGFGNALRNKLAQLYGQGELSGPEARTCFLAVFYGFILSAVFLSGVFSLAKWALPWKILLPSPNPQMIEQGAFLITVGGSLLAFNIAFNTYSSGFFGYQESHWNALFNGLSKAGLLLSTLVFVFLGMSFGSINLMLFAITLGFSVIGWVYFLKFRRWPLGIIPRRTIWEKIKELWRPSSQFALLQIFFTGLLNADYFVVSHVLGLETVGDYFLVKKIYLVLGSFHFALLLPLWSAYTESLADGNVEWISRTLRKTAVYTLLIFSAGTLFMAAWGDWVVYLWTGKRVQPGSLFAWLGVWGLLYGWSNCFGVFLNGTGHLKRQVFLVMLAAVAFVPLALLLGRPYGASGICFALIAVLLPVAVSNPWQSFGLVRGYLNRRALSLN